MLHTINLTLSYTYNRDLIIFRLFSLIISLLCTITIYGILASLNGIQTMLNSFLFRFNSRFLAHLAIGQVSFCHG